MAGYGTQAQGAEDPDEARQTKEEEDVISFQQALFVFFFFVRSFVCLCVWSVVFALGGLHYRPLPLSLLIWMVGCWLPLLYM